MTLIGRDITLLRKETGLTIHQFSHLIGVSEATYYRWIQEEFSPNIPTSRYIYALVFMHKTHPAMVDEFRAIIGLDKDRQPPLEPLKPFKTSERLGGKHKKRT